MDDPRQLLEGQGAQAPVVGVLGEREQFAAIGLGLCEQPSPHAEQPSAAQRLGARRTRGSAYMAKHGVEPRETFGPVTTEKPEPPQRAGKPQLEVVTRGGVRPVECRAQVVMLNLEEVER